MEHAPQPQGPPKAAAPHLLLVENDRALLACAATYLLSHGYRVDCAEKAGEAMALLEAHSSYAAVITDLDPPLYRGKNGFDVIRRASRLVPKPVILLWSGIVSPGVRRLAIASSVDTCIERSTLRGLEEALAKALELRERLRQVALQPAEGCEEAEVRDVVGWG